MGMLHGARENEDTLDLKAETFREAGELEMATMTTSKQQELEEHLAKLVGLMEQQWQRQEQLAEEQRWHQEDLAGQQCGRCRRPWPSS